MKLNKYLKELGLTQEDLPGYYDPNLKGNKAGADPRNKENEEGFCGYEFFSLDYSLALYIYPRLCEFRNEYATFGTPAYFCYDENENEVENGNELWLEALDKMILAFKYIILDPADIEWREKDKIIDEGLKLFAEHYRALWY